MYANIPFGLMNVGATFQRSMDIDLAQEKDKFVIVYMDGITMYSRSDKEHIKHLEKVFSEMKKVWYIVEPQKIKFCIGGRKTVREHYFKTWYKD